LKGIELSKVSSFIAATVAGVFLATANFAQAETSHLKWNKSTSKNRPFVVSENWDVHPDCSLRAYPVVKVTSQPKHATAKVGRGKFTIGRKLQKDSYYRCKSFNVSGTTVLYTPDRDFTGKDQLKLRVRYSTGDIHEIDVTVTVR